MKPLLPAVVLPLLMGLAGCSTPPAQQTVYFTVLHTNDQHGSFWRSPNGEGGQAARKTAIDQVRAEVKANGGHVLLLDAGDVNTGRPESDSLQAEPDFRGMSMLGYDAMAVGNHEFDRTPAIQQQQQSWSTFPWLAANVFSDGRPLFRSHQLFDLGPLRIAVLGLTTEETTRLGIGIRFPGVHFEKAASSAQQIVPTLRKQADLVLALTHLGHYEDGRHGVSEPGDVELARSVPGIDVIVGGHSHSVVCMQTANVREPIHDPSQDCKPDRQDKTWILQAGDRGRWMGRADFRWKAGRLELLSYRMLPINLKITSVIREDVGVLELLAPFQERAATQFNAVVGQIVDQFDGERSSVRWRRTNMGMLVATALQQSVGADCAVLSGGGLRASLPVGPVRLGDLFGVLPFRNKVVTVTFSGSELVTYVTAIARMNPGSGAFAQYSGLSFTWDGTTLSDLQVGGKTVRDNQSYRLALPSFIADGGDGYPDLRTHATYRDSGLVDVEVLREFLSSHSPIKAQDYAPPIASRSIN